MFYGCCNKDHKPGCLTERNFLPHISGDEKSENKVMTGLVPLEDYEEDSAHASLPALGKHTGFLVYR